MIALNVLVVMAVGFLYFDYCLNMRVIPERTNIDSFNTMYINNFSASVRRYSRKGGYYLNAEATTKHVWGDNISFHMVFYEFLHNEYKPSFVEFHFKKLCEMINKDPYIGKAVKDSLMKSGISCPVPVGHIVLANMSVDTAEFPYLWPFQRAKAVVTFMADRHFILNFSIYAKFEQKKVN